MNILIVTPAGKINGTARTFQAWIKALHALGHRVFLCSGQGHLAEWSSAFCEKQYACELARFEPSIPRLRRILQIVSTDKIDVIWGVGTTSSLLGALAGLLRNVHFISILNISRRYVWPPNPQWKYPFVGRIVTLSQQYSELLTHESQIPADYCHVVAARFDLDELQPEFPITSGPLQRQLAVSVFRRFDTEKTLGIESFFWSIAKYRRSLAHCTFHLYGGGNSEKRVDALVAELRALDVDVANDGYTDDVRGRMVRSDIVVGSERVAVEALLCGRPVCILGDSGIVGFVTRKNIELFLLDNFTGLRIPRQSLPSLEETLGLFRDYGALLAECDLEYCHGALKSQFAAVNGAQDLIRLSKARGPDIARVIKLLRVIRALLLMYATQLRRALGSQGSSI